jgi:hypothetical protein
MSGRVDEGKNGFDLSVVEHLGLFGEHGVSFVMKVRRNNIF